VELLIVISIIGVLIALLMPAVKSAQESSRRAQCLNNVKQIAAACLALESQQRHLPTGGWGWQMAGDPDRGYGSTQPGGWHFNILPYLDLSDLHDMGKGLSTPGDTANSKRMAAGQAQARVAVPIFLCPTRHRLQVFPRSLRNDYVNIVDPSPLMGRSDYAANAGTSYSNVDPGSPNPSYSLTFDWSSVDGTINSTNSPATGVIFRASQLSTAKIKDGESNVYLIGERYLDPDCYYTAGCCDNDQGWDEGYDWDTNRGTGTGYVNVKLPDTPPPVGSGTPLVPMQDQAGVGGCMQNFGSAHESGFNMAFCDGAARSVSFAINPTVHMQLGHRSDGLPTDLSQIDAGK
jgi:prepilin-type processing-associated H-X9-DG protein